MGRQKQREDRATKDTTGKEKKDTTSNLKNFRLRAAAVLTGLMLMLFVPVLALDDARPAKFGWHMYAAAVDLPKVEVEFHDGNRVERSIGSIASGFRPEIDYFQPIAQHLCGREANAASVIMSREHPNRKVVISCDGF
jgi:hypothetical protein